MQAVEDRRTFAEVVAGQRVETESKTLSKGSVGKIVVQPFSILDEIGKKEKFAP